MTAGDPAPDYTVTYTGWVNGESISTVSPVLIPILACDYTPESSSDYYDTTFTQAPTFDNYSVTTVNGTLEAMEAPPTFSMAPMRFSANLEPSLNLESSKELAGELVNDTEISDEEQEQEINNEELEPEAAEIVAEVKKEEIVENIEDIILEEQSQPPVSEKKRTERS